MIRNRNRDRDKRKGIRIGTTTVRIGASMNGGIGMKMPQRSKMLVWCSSSARRAATICPRGRAIWILMGITMRSLALISPFPKGANQHLFPNIWEGSAI